MNLIKQEILQGSPDSIFNRPRLLLTALIALPLLALGAYALDYAGGRPLKAEQPTGQATTTTLFDFVTLTAKSAIVLDLSRGTMLYQKNADEQLPLASITKIMLVHAIHGHLDLDDEIVISTEDVRRGEGGGPHSGEVWRVRDLIDYTLMASSNVGAEALARAATSRIRAAYPIPENPTGGAVVWRMNERAKELGLSQTYFLNVSGLDLSGEVSGGYGSARDIGRLFAEVIAYDRDVYAATSENGLRLVSRDGLSRDLRNTNEALAAIPGLVFGKTGFTDLAGGNLAVMFEIGPARPIVAVVLGSTQEGRFVDMKILVKAAKATLSEE